jgi:hypothetical protein
VRASRREEQEDDREEEEEEKEEQQGQGRGQGLRLQDLRRRGGRCRVEVIDSFFFRQVANKSLRKL